MIQEIMRDTAFLAQKAEPATPDDLQVAADLLETLVAHKDGCVGMAANMIWVNKRIIAFDNDGGYMVMFNPEIVKKSEPYETEEGCLSLAGTRKVGAHKKEAQERVTATPAQKEYAKAYNRLKARKQRGKISVDDWNSAVAKAQDLKEQTERGGLTDEELRRLLTAL